MATRPDPDTHFPRLRVRTPFQYVTHGDATIHYASRHVHVDWCVSVSARELWRAFDFGMEEDIETIVETDLGTEFETEDVAAEIEVGTEFDCFAALDTRWKCWCIHCEEVLFCWCMEISRGGDQNQGSKSYLGVSDMWEGPKWRGGWCNIAGLWLLFGVVPSYLPRQ